MRGNQGMGTKYWLVYDCSMSKCVHTMNTVLAFIVLRSRQSYASISRRVISRRYSCSHQWGIIAALLGSTEVCIFAHGVNAPVLALRKGSNWERWGSSQLYY